MVFSQYINKTEDIIMDLTDISSLIVNTLGVGLNFNN